MHELHDISDLDPDGLPTNRSLVKATLVAIIIATALLVTVILPAEYGVDPTGIGARLGLTALHAAKTTEAAPAVPTPVPAGDAGAGAGLLRQDGGRLRSDDMTVTLAPQMGAEIKAVMKAGESFVYRWQVEGGSVYVDMHGEPPGPGDNFTSFKVGEQQTVAGGTYTAPFDGTHGWYWQNRGDAPVTVHLITSGFYETLFMP